MTLKNIPNPYGLKWTESMQKPRSIHPVLFPWTSKISRVMFHVLNNYVVQLVGDVNLYYKQVSREMLNYCHSPATDLDSWRWKEDSDCLLRHLEKHKSPRFTTSCTKVLFLLCFCAVICIVLLVKWPVFLFFKAILKFCTSCILSQAFTGANGEIFRSPWGLQYWWNTFF